MEQFKVQARDLDGIINQMRLTQGVEAAVFLYALDENRYKVSLRSNGKVGVSAIAMTFGGGGHYMAAGCTMEGAGRDYRKNRGGDQASAGYGKGLK